MRCAMLIVAMMGFGAMSSAYAIAPDASARSLDGAGQWIEAADASPAALAPAQSTDCAQNI